MTDSTSIQITTVAMASATLAAPTATPSVASGLTKTRSASRPEHTTAAAPADQPAGGAGAMSRHPCPPPPSPDAFTVSVKTLDGRSLQVDVSPRTLVIEVKAELAARLGREACELVLVFAGARLDDTMQLEAYGMKLATTIHLVASN